MILGFSKGFLFDGMDLSEGMRSFKASSLFLPIFYEDLGLGGVSI